MTSDFFNNFYTLFADNLFDGIFNLVFLPLFIADVEKFTASKASLSSFQLVKTSNTTGLSELPGLKNTSASESYPSLLDADIYSQPKSLA